MGWEIGNFAKGTRRYESRMVEEGKINGCSFQRDRARLLSQVIVKIKGAFKNRISSKWKRWWM